MLSTLLTLFLVGLVTLVVGGIVLAIIGVIASVALGIAAVLLFKIAPIVLVGYIVLRLIAGRRGRRQLTAEDRRWLETGE